MSSKLVLTGLVCGLLGIFGQPMSAQTGSLTGSWELTFTPGSSTPVVSIPGLATFASDGTTVETDASQFVPSAVTGTAATVYGSAGHGTWILGPTMLDFIVSFESVQAAKNESLHARRTYQLIVTPDPTGTTLSGTYTIVTVPVTGPSTTVTGTVTGKKLVIAPPPGN